jgi:hypothetical protein
VWTLTLALLMCLSVDFSNPLLPGVVRLDESESIPALRAARVRPEEPTALATRPAAIPVRATGTVAATPRRAPSVTTEPTPARWLPSPRSGREAVRAAPAPDGDH